MKKGFISIFILLSILLFTPALAGLIVYGDGFVFIVQEPKGWIGNTKNANENKINLLMYRSSETFDTASTMIRILAIDKTDENIEKDLEYDIQQTKRREPDVLFSDLSISHQTYQCCSRVFYRPNDFYDYVTYINPGKGSRMVYSIAMNVLKHPASKDELNVFQEIVSSFMIMNKNIDKERPLNNPNNTTKQITPVPEEKKKRSLILVD